MMDLFPEGMSTSQYNFDIDTIASKLTYFHEQVQLIHWQTMSYAEHKATGELYEFVQSFKDDVVEKLIGYTGKRPKAFKVEPLKEVLSNQVASDIIKFAYSLKEWAEMNQYCDIENMADELSGVAAKTKYLLTLT